VRRLALAPLIGFLLTGCGGKQSVEGRIPGSTLKIYVSGPLHGASSVSARAAMRGAEMALSERGARIGRYRIVLELLDDSTPQSRGWDPNQTTTNARTAAQDPATVGYIGDFDSGASAISIPPLNRAGIPQVSPQGGAVGLTSPGPGASPGEPEKYYPAKLRTFARVVPTDALEEVVVVHLEQSLGCRAPFALQDGEVDGEDATISYVLTAQAAGLRVLGVQAFQRQARDYLSLARSLGQAGADCVLVSASDERSAARVVAAIARQLPDARIFASSSLADSAFTDPEMGGVPLAAAPQVRVLSPGLPASAYPPAGRAFLARYTSLFGAPQPQAIFGYEAMRLMLDAISRSTDDGRRQAARAKVLAAIFATRRRRSALGTYSIDRDGDVTIRSFAVYRLVGGTLSFLEQEVG
jgi:branched-chain amino acid transport system substrate-binding protein